MADQIHIQRKTVVNIRSLLRKMGLLDGAAIVQEKKGNGGEEGQDSRGASTTMGNGLPRDAVTGAMGSHGITPGVLSRQDTSCRRAKSASWRERRGAIARAGKASETSGEDHT